MSLRACADATKAEGETRIAGPDQRHVLMIGLSSGHGASMGSSTRTKYKRAYTIDANYTREFSHVVILQTSAGYLCYRA